MAYRSLSDKQLFSSFGEAKMTCSGLKGFKRVKWRKASLQGKVPGYETCVKYTLVFLINKPYLNSF